MYIKKNIHYILTIIFTVLFITPVSGQIIKGYVYDAQTSEPLIGVNISYTVKGEVRGTTTDVDGAYELQLVEGGADVLYSYIGYVSKLVPLVVNRRDVIRRDIYLNMETNLLEDIVISAGRFEQKLSEITVSMDLLKAADITKQAPTDLSATLKTLPGVDVNDKQPSIRGGSGWTYGVGARSLILVDGMSILNPGTGEINWNIIPIENVEQVEILKGASSVLYGSSALNGLINVRTARPGLTPKTTIRASLGIYGSPANNENEWWDKSFWQEGKYGVTPLLRNSLLSGVRNPIYESYEFFHSRRIGHFDVSGGMNLFTDEGYKEQGYNKRFRIGGNITYHQPGINVVNYGFNTNFLSNKYGDFFMWRSPKNIYEPSPFTDMTREGNLFYLDPFFNFTNPRKDTSHKIKGRFFYRGENIVNSADSGKSLTEILGNMGTDANAIAGLVSNFQNGDYSDLYPIIPPLLEGDLNGVIDGATGLLNQLFPTADTTDLTDLIGWIMQRGLPTGGTSELIPWLTNAIEPQLPKTKVDHFYSYYVDYQYSKRFETAQITAGTTYEHLKSRSVTSGDHDSDNIAVFFQYDQRFFDRLSISAGVRTEYYRVDSYDREAETNVFGVKIPVKPIFRGGLNYQLADYSFLRASFGQGYRYPSIVEKYARRDIGGVGIYPNEEVKAEKGINAELGIKQGYKIGNLQGFVDMVGFFTQYNDMIEFRFGAFDNTTYKVINSIPDLVDMMIAGHMPGVGAQFYNVSKARIYGVDLSTNGVYNFNKNAKLFYNLGYVFIEPEDVNYKEKNQEESQYTDPLQMKEKSNESKYLKYRQKHTVKGTFDFQWKRLNLGTNMSWKSKTLAVDYMMLDEREKPYGKKDLMDYIRDIMFGNVDGETLTTYWNKHNKSYFIMDLRMGVKVTNKVQFQFMINNLFNKEYSVRPMAVGAPRTYVMQINMTF